jgi:N-acylneuraminate cytidylyltransferase
MGNAAIIPIKSHSERLPGKNFRLIRGKPLYTHIISHALEADCFDRVLVDTDSEEIAEYARPNCEVIERKPELADDSANGNDLLVYHASIIEADWYYQLFATAPFLTPFSIKSCCDVPGGYDSVLTAREISGWFWLDGHPVNFRPGILPRSQDARWVWQESTGLYGITREAIKRYNCRIGANPYFFPVDEYEAMDIDTYEDYRRAEEI